MVDDEGFQEGASKPKISRLLGTGPHDVSLDDMAERPALFRCAQQANRPNLSSTRIDI